MFRGSMVALVTPMHQNGNIDKVSLVKLVQFHLAQGTDAIVVMGTTGESATLSAKERRDVIAIVLNEVNKKIPVIAGTGTCSTATTITGTQDAMNQGVDACLLVVPYYNKPTQEGLYHHYKTIAGAVPIPLILYNVPGRTSCDLLPDTVQRLATIPNIIGIKEAVGRQERYSELIEKCSDHMDIYSGDDVTGLMAMQLGAKAIISVTANLAPKLMHEMCAAALADDQPKAEAINQQLHALHGALLMESNPIPCKWALHKLGLIPPGLRLPLTPLSKQYYDDVVSAMQAAQLLPNGVQ